jgi:hypothetical protein
MLMTLALRLLFPVAEAKEMSSLEAQASKIAEISGWDMDENFFVEKALLHHYQDGNNKVGLRARLRVGSLVFVRVPDEASLDRTVPVTYQVLRIDGSASHGAREVQLIRLRPRETATRTLLQFTFRETAVN